MATPNLRALSVEFLTEFIRIYKRNPALWKVRSKKYVNKYLKKNGYEELVQWCQTAIATADKDFVVRKINSLRGAFRKEHQKVRKSRKDGSSEEYVPHLWYYNLLLFTAKQDKDIGDIKSDLLSTDDSTDSTDNGESDRMDSVANTKSQRKRNIKEEFAYIITNSPSATTTAALPEMQSIATSSTRMLDKKEDEYDAFGFVVAAKLRKMTEDQKIYAEYLINQIIHKGLLNNLSTNTNIEDG